MTIFLLLATLLISLTLWFIHSIWNNKKNPTEEIHFDWQVMLAKRNEIERDELLPPQARTVLREEWLQMADTVLSRQHNQDLNNTSLTKNHAWWIVVSSAICAVIVYSMLGQVDAQALQLPARHQTVNSDSNPFVATDNSRHPGNNASIDELISQLEKKLMTSPDNLDGWILLARSLSVKRDFVGAKAALEHALGLAPKHPDILAALNEISAMTNNESASTSTTPSIEGNVRLSPQLIKLLYQSGMPDNATLFIVAKSPAGGPPMPLAVDRFPAQQLINNPSIQFRLDDSKAMNPALKLSSQSEVNLEARVSMSGTAMKQSGDFYVVIPKVKLGAKNLQLEIQSVLP